MPTITARPVSTPAAAAAQRRIAELRVDLAAERGMFTGEAKLALLALCQRDAAFTTDEVWHALDALGLTPSEPRVIASIVRWGAANGLCQATADTRPSRRADCHRRPVRVWRPTTTITTIDPASDALRRAASALDAFANAGPEPDAQQCIAAVSDALRILDDDQASWRDVASALRRAARAADAIG